eukprot:tig00000158_g10214.t2
MFWSADATVPGDPSLPRPLPPPNAKRAPPKPARGERDMPQDHWTIDEWTAAPVPKPRAKKGPGGRGSPSRSQGYSPKSSMEHLPAIEQRPGTSGSGTSSHRKMMEATQSSQELSHAQFDTQPAPRGQQHLSGVAGVRRMAREKRKEEERKKLLREVGWNSGAPVVERIIPPYDARNDPYLPRAYRLRLRQLQLPMSPEESVMVHHLYTVASSEAAKQKARVGEKLKEGDARGRKKDHSTSSPGKSGPQGPPPARPGPFETVSEARAQARQGPPQDEGKSAHELLEDLLREVDEAEAPASPAPAAAATAAGPTAAEAAEEAGLTEEELNRRLAKLQARFRGIKTRKELEERGVLPRRVSPEAEGAEVAAAEAQARAEEERARDEMKEEARAIRGEYDAGAIESDELNRRLAKLQARYRGYKARKDLEERGIVVAPRRASVGEAERAGIAADARALHEEAKAGDVDDAELGRRLAKLQARYRGYKTRKELEGRGMLPKSRERSEPGTAEPPGAAAPAAPAQEADPKKVERGVAKLQAMYRGQKAREQVRKKRAEVKRARAPPPKPPGFALVIDKVPPEGWKEPEKVDKQTQEKLAKKIQALYSGRRCGGAGDGDALPGASGRPLSDSPESEPPPPSQRGDSATSGEDLDNVDLAPQPQAAPARPQLKLNLGGSAAPAPAPEARDKSAAKVQAMFRGAKTRKELGARGLKTVTPHQAHERLKLDIAAVKRAEEEVVEPRHAEADLDDVPLAAPAESVSMKNKKGIKLDLKSPSMKRPKSSKELMEDRGAHSEAEGHDLDDVDLVPSEEVVAASVSVKNKKGIKLDLKSPSMKKPKSSKELLEDRAAHDDEGRELDEVDLAEGEGDAPKKKLALKLDLRSASMKHPPVSVGELIEDRDAAHGGGGGGGGGGAHELDDVDLAKPDTNAGAATARAKPAVRLDLGAASSTTTGERADAMLEKRPEEIERMLDDVPLAPPEAGPPKEASHRRFKLQFGGAAGPEGPRPEEEIVEGRPDRERAATRVQSMVRGYQTRKHLSQKGIKTTAPSLRIQLPQSGTVKKEELTESRRKSEDSDADESEATTSSRGVAPAMTHRAWGGGGGGGGGDDRYADGAMTARGARRRQQEEEDELEREIKEAEAARIQAMFRGARAREGLRKKGLKAKAPGEAKRAAPPAPAAPAAGPSTSSASPAKPAAKFQLAKPQSAGSSQKPATKSARSDGNSAKGGKGGIRFAGGDDESGGSSGSDSESTASAGVAPAMTHRAWGGGGGGGGDDRYADGAMTARGARRRQQEEEDELEREIKEAQAARIQAGIRGYLERKRLEDKGVVTVAKKKREAKAKQPKAKGEGGAGAGAGGEEGEEDDSAAGLSEGALSRRVAANKSFWRPAASEADREDDGLDDDIRESSAIRIQAAFRGAKTRDGLRAKGHKARAAGRGPAAARAAVPLSAHSTKQLASTSGIKKVDHEEGRISHERARRESNDLTPTPEITDKIRRIHADSEFAATKIQALGRGFVGRKRVQRIKAERAKGSGGGDPDA